MKPFFSIRIDYNPSDSEDIVACDRASLRLVIGREVEWEEGQRNYESLQKITETCVEALSWLGGKADSLGVESFFEGLLSELALRRPETFNAAVAYVIKDFDADELNALDAAKTRAIAKDNEVLRQDDEEPQP